MSMSKKVTSITKGCHEGNVASYGVSGRPLRSSGPKDIASAAREPFGMSMELGRKDPWVASGRQCQNLADRRRWDPVGW